MTRGSNRFAKKPNRLWEMYLMAKTYHVQPSVLLHVRNERNAFRIDRAVSLFGNALSAELDSVTGKKEAEIEAKRKRIRERWLGPTDPTASSAQPAKGFKDPAASLRKG